MRITIGGDVSVHGYDNSDEIFHAEKLLAEQDWKTLFKDIPTEFEKSDRVIVNLECAITDKDTAIRKCGPNLKAPFGTAEVLKKIGVTHCCVSNNHIFDYGKAGVKDTFEQLDKSGIGYTGFGENVVDARKNLIIEQEGKKIAVICVSEHEFCQALPDRMGAREYDPYDTNDDIVEAKKNADFVIVIYHGGKEEFPYPSPRLHKACRSMVKHGADVVLCQHSHCIGCYENFMGGHILYGQGNFHFLHAKQVLMDARYWTEALLVHLDIDKEIKITFVPTVMEKNGTRLANAEEKALILKEFEERNKILAEGGWLKLWKENCQKWNEYKNLVPPEKEYLLAHFLDCEAHTDVLRELYFTWNQTNEKD